jgi:hypothetical protein
MSDTSTEIAFAGWLLKNTIPSTDKEFFVYNGENFWSIPELYAIFKQSPEHSDTGKDDYWPDLEKKIRDKFEIGERGRTFKIPIDELIEFLKQNKKECK